jgi:hypothetical protein
MSQMNEMPPSGNGHLACGRLAWLCLDLRPVGKGNVAEGGARVLERNWIGARLVDDDRGRGEAKVEGVDQDLRYARRTRSRRVRSHSPEWVADA